MLFAKPAPRGTRHEARYNESFHEDSTRISRGHFFRKQIWIVARVSRGVSRERSTRSFTRCFTRELCGTLFSRVSRQRVSRDVSRAFHDRFHEVLFSVHMRIIRLMLHGNVCLFSRGGFTRISRGNCAVLFFSRVSREIVSRVSRIISRVSRVSRSWHEKSVITSL